MSLQPTWRASDSEGKLGMQAGVLLWRHSFFRAIRRTVVFSSPVNQIAYSFNPFGTETAALSSEESSKPNQEEESKSLSWRIEKLPRGEPVGLAFQSWMGEGCPIHRGHIFHAINRLRKLKFNKRALEDGKYLFQCGMNNGNCIISLNWMLHPTQEAWLILNSLPFDSWEI